MTQNTGKAAMMTGRLHGLASLLNQHTPPFTLQIYYFFLEQHDFDDYFFIFLLIFEIY